MHFEDWAFTPPQSAPLGDHEVPLRSHHLKGRRIALVVTGGIAALKTPLLARALRRRGAEVTAFCSEEALHYVGSQALEWATLKPLVTSFTWQAEHLSDDCPFDAWLVAPATYNTIGKMASGIADTVVTAALTSALGRLQKGETKILIAPTMHGTMHTPIFERNCRELAGMGVTFIPPRDDYGKHNLPDANILVAAVCRALSTSFLKNKRILVTAGTTPVPIDGVRRIVNRFRGRLGAAITEELVLRGSTVRFLLGDGAWRPPSWLPCTIAPTYDDYKRLTLDLVAEGFDAGIFSAGVADYQPKQIVSGKIPSGRNDLMLELQPTEKIIDLVRAADQYIYMVTFKYLEKVTVEELLATARSRLDRFPVVVANRGEETHDHEQAAWIVTTAGEQRVVGKTSIAIVLADHLERAIGSNKND